MTKQWWFGAPCHSEQSEESLSSNHILDSSALPQNEKTGRAGMLLLRIQDTTKLPRMHTRAVGDFSHRHGLSGREAFALQPRDSPRQFNALLGAELPERLLPHAKAGGSRRRALRLRCCARALLPRLLYQVLRLATRLARTPCATACCCRLTGAGRALFAHLPRCRPGCCSCGQAEGTLAQPPGASACAVATLPPTTAAGFAALECVFPDHQRRERCDLINCSKADDAADDQRRDPLSPESKILMEFRLKVAHQD